MEGVGTFYMVRKYFLSFLRSYSENCSNVMVPLIFSAESDVFRRVCTGYLQISCTLTVPPSFYNKVRYTASLCHWVINHLHKALYFILPDAYGKGREHTSGICVFRKLKLGLFKVRVCRWSNR